jgi:hypothetical protein
LYWVCSGFLGMMRGYNREMLSLEKQRVCQRVLEEQGYLVIFSGVAREAGEVVRDIYFQGEDSDAEPMPSLVVAAEATLADAQLQHRRFFATGEFFCLAPAPYYYKMVAE